MFVQDVVGAQPCNHAKETKHQKVENSGGRQATYKEHHNSFWGRWEEALQSLEGEFVMVVNGGNSLSVSTSAGSSDRRTGVPYSFSSLKLEAGLTPLAAGHTYREDRHDGSGVS